ncbi:MAG: FG-GAP repeat protein [Elusimicrobia bacterium]|nr:FG-GAP repeat protein [Elusimicrobiota bacterium]
MNSVRPKKLFLVAGGLAAALTLFAASASNSFFSGDENATVINDLYSASFWGGPAIGTGTGDFDGNGQDDVALFLARMTGPQEVAVVLNPLPGKSFLSQANVMRIVVSTTNSRIGPDYYYTTPLFADLNDDGRQDLVLKNKVVFGKEDPSAMDIVNGLPDFQVIGKPVSGMCQGDFNGDQVDDLFLGGTGEGFLLFGTSALSRGILDLSTANSIPRIVASFNKCVTGDFNNDGKDDLALSNPMASVGGRTNNGEINIVFGTTTFPNTWTLGNPPANVRVWGAGGVSAVPSDDAINAQNAGDVTGDGKDELSINIGHSFFIVDGSDLDGRYPIVDLRTTTVHTMPTNGGIYDLDMVDFDGDASADVFLYYVNGTSGFLTSDLGLGSQRLGNMTVPSLQWSLGVLAGGNLGGDAPRDLVGYEDLLPSEPPYGAVRILYGFQPLKNPSVHIRERSPSSPRVSLELQVDGDPTEVLLTGDVADPFRDRWLPYQASLPVDLSYAEGPKRVQATFRNAVGRQSEPATDTVSLAVGSPGTELFTNVLRRGGHVRFDCSLTSPGHVKAEVFDREGTSIAHLLDEAYGPGVWPVVWDGKNAGGHGVSPGMYVVVLTVNGHAEIHKVIVQG